MVLAVCRVRYMSHERVRLLDTCTCTQQEAEPPFLGHGGVLSEGDYPRQKFGMPFEKSLDWCSHGYSCS